MEPQEIIWNDSGQLFDIPTLHANKITHALSPFEGICEFSASEPRFPGTIFRFPLRTSKSELSENVFSLDQLRELFEAVKEEAKVLLLFLRSVDKIEVYEKNDSGATLSFRVCIQEREALAVHRKRFMDQLEENYKKAPLNAITELLSEFYVEVKDYSLPLSPPMISHWLTCTAVGSADQEVLTLAAKRKTVPWVGTALELNGSCIVSHSQNRIFCFLPMPLEANSPFPIHINATFGLNDDRRTLKWMDLERKNDLTAKWNTMIVSRLLPHCYFQLLIYARQHLKPQEFYQAWPDISKTSKSPWEALLQPLFESLLEKPIVSTQGIRDAKWIMPKDGVFVLLEEQQPPTVVLDTISKCAMKLVMVPNSVLAALDHFDITVMMVSPKFTKECLRKNPQSYVSLIRADKYEILQYCLLDDKYHDLQGINLLPLAEKGYSDFREVKYLCTENCPAFLLPNQSSILVNVLTNPELYQGLTEVAQSGTTQLRELTTLDVVRLLPRPTVRFPTQIHPISDFKLPKDWFEKFWKWVEDKALDQFSGKLLVPVKVPSRFSLFSVVNITELKKSKVLYIPSDSRASLPQFIKALSKLQVLCCQEKDFPYVLHKQLSSILYTVNHPTNVLDAISCSSANISQVSLSKDEAESIKEFLSGSLHTDELDDKRLAVLRNLPVFTTSTNTSNKLCSVSNAASSSILGVAMREPDRFVLNSSCLPSSVYIFLANYNYSQASLLSLLEKHRLVTNPTNTDFLLNHLFPLIDGGHVSKQNLKIVMKEVLGAIPAFMRVTYRSSQTQLFHRLEYLVFLEDSKGQLHSPQDLYDPSNLELQELFKGEDVFPTHPFNNEVYLKHLKECGLQQSVTSQEIVNIICSIAPSHSRSPRRVSTDVMCRSKAVLKYLNKCNLDENVWYKGTWQTLSSILLQLSKGLCWLPVCHTPPKDYPSHMVWNGTYFNSHFISLCDMTLVLPKQDADLPDIITGSQVYVVRTELSQERVTHIFGCEVTSLVKHVVSHFKKLITLTEKVHRNTMDHIVRLTYTFFLDAKQKGLLNELQLLKFPSKWIWIKKHNFFVSPSSVALEQCSTFHHNLEPFVFILPYDLCEFADLFADFGMPRQVTVLQIVSVLESMHKLHRPHRSPTEALDIVMSILNWLTDGGSKKASLPRGTTLYVPTESKSATPIFHLADTKGVVYTDTEFLKQYIMSDKSDQLYTCVHEQINPKLARCLGLRSLSNHLGITEDTFEDAGQHIPLTVRLKAILRDYKDGLTIIKELIQNADDAEATEVNICYDACTHCIDPKRLFFPGMTSAHGPALVVHNNSTFSREDMENITKLEGATKQGKPLKIGKFGIGFCSVYHITDIPSFVSQDTLCILDPTLSCLKEVIKNPTKPGQRVKFTGEVVATSDQLAPYNGLFGFNSTAKYNGTMFRLPFRTHASELSSTIYSEDSVYELLSNICDNASKLLLFLQHVQRITFSRRDKGCKATPMLLLEVTKSSLAVPSPLMTTGHFKICSCSRNTIKVKQTSSTFTVEEQWLVASSTDIVLGKHATASVACQVKLSQSSLTLNSIQGEAFCFLPLGLSTGLPVHVSSTFELLPNRVGIWTSDGCSSSGSEVIWNEELMQKMIPHSYYLLLLTLKSLEQQGKLDSYKFYSLWPVKQWLEQQYPWSILIDSLYSIIQESTLFYSSSTKTWLMVNGSKFLKADILRTPSEKSLPQCVLKTVRHLDLPVVDIPSHYQDQDMLDLSTSIISEKDFVELFFDSILSFSETVDLIQTRNDVLCHILEVYASHLSGVHPDSSKSYLQHYLKTYPCIPCVPKGVLVRRCKDTIDQRAPCAQLFDEEEAKFPISEFCDNQLVRTALLELGMLSGDAPWHILTERAETIKELYAAKALQRVILLLKCMESTVLSVGCDEVTTLSNVPFLPVMPKPYNYPLPWYDDRNTFLCGCELVLEGQTSQDAMPSTFLIAGSKVSILNKELLKHGGYNYISRKVLDLLQIRPHPTVNEVLGHFKALICLFESNQHEIQLLEWTDRITCQVYIFLNKYFEEAEPTSWSELTAINCIWTGSCFISTNIVAFEWSIQYGPYLYGLPPQLAALKNLTQALEIKKTFTKDDLLNALEYIANDFKDRPVEGQSLHILDLIIHSLKDTLSSTEQEESGKFFLPDVFYIMHEASKMAFNDAPWCTPDRNHIFVHEKLVTRSLAIKLGVKPVRSRMLDMHAEVDFIGSVFGQKEDLTRRIQNILCEYPFDITILKELLQNADDAKASKMYVILDKRTHADVGIFSDKWKDLQGPALLVWNDKIFSEKDLGGIQRLGTGSKTYDPETIGQYGIGFNAVYHLTDCPSLINGGETLCIFDPHCHYVPGACKDHPGRRIELSPQFWSEFPGIKSPLFRENIEDCPKELLSGSLFRFPLRHTKELVNSSQIIMENVVPLTPDKMQQWLAKWAPQMKQHLLFLNYVTELSFFVIETSANVLLTELKITLELSETDQICRNTLHTSAALFDDTHCSKPCIETYQISITQHQPMSVPKHNTEKWLVQQGVGDILSTDAQDWKFLSLMKPCHGIAVPLDDKNLSQKIRKGSDKNRSSFKGQVFCFLPLPVMSNLPVHVNGQFILDSSRKALWKADDKDDKTRWNENLIRAISSSYAKLLIEVQNYVIPQQPTSKAVLHKCIAQYYSVFPQWISDSDGAEGVWRTLAFDVYKKLNIMNAQVLATIIEVKESPIKEKKSHATVKTQCYVKWYNITGEEQSLTQVYFSEFPQEMPHKMKDMLKEVLQQLGMNITCAPLRIRTHFRKVEVDIPVTDPNTVFGYYTSFCQLTDEPHEIQVTSFKSVDSFKMFLGYILKTCESDDIQDFKCFEFPKEPFDCALLLTADCKLRRFDKENKVISSDFSDLFPCNQDLFLHPELRSLCLKHNYFVSVEGDPKEYPIVNCILSNFLPRSFRTTRVLNALQHFHKGNLKTLWKCFCSDLVFKAHLPDILKEWALLLTKDNQLFSCTGQALQPIIELSEDASKDKTKSSVNPIDYQKVKGVLQLLKMPFLSMELIPSIDTVRIFCTSLQDPEYILQNLFYIQQEFDMTPSLLHSKETLVTLINYLKNINIKRNLECMCHLLRLPLFEDVDHSLTSLVDCTVHVWPNNVCPAGRMKWRKGRKVMFLCREGLWSGLGSIEDIGGKPLHELDVYIRYIFPGFGKLNEEERYSHLDHIRDHVFALAKANTHSEDPSMHESAHQFIASLKELPCIGAHKKDLHYISEFYDHRIGIVTMFPNVFRTLPKHFCEQEYTEEHKQIFFSELGLKQSITRNEYLKCCQLIQDGEQPDVRKSTMVLLKYLFPHSHEKHISMCPPEWYKDDIFLKELSYVQFIPVDVEQLSCLTQIAPCYSCSDDTDTMTALHGAGMSERKELMWTVRPIISLPQWVYSDISSSRKKSYHYISVLQHLGVVFMPSASDIVKHVRNISLSKYAKFSLLNRCQTPYLNELQSKTGIKILYVLLENYKYLSTFFSHVKELDQLKRCQCIPVHILRPSAEAKVLLVKPEHVLTTNYVECYFPYLHKLPDEMSAVIPLLERIGVRNNFELTHFRYVLDTLFQQSHGSHLDDELAKMMQRVVKALYSKLNEVKIQSSLGDEDITTSLTPLYLPTNNCSLCTSTSLLHRDTFTYENIILNLTGTGFCVLHISQKKYGFNEEQFCSLLPETVRPRKMSQCCLQTLAQDLEVVEESKHALSLKECFSQPSLPETLLLMVGKITRNDDLMTLLRSRLTEFFNNIEVQVIHSLTANIMLYTDVGASIMIGSTECDYLLQHQAGHVAVTLSVNSQATNATDMVTLKAVAEHLISFIECESSSVTSQLTMYFMMALTGKCIADHQSVLRSLGVRLNLDDGKDEIVFEADITPRLGKSIPASWQHRLTQHMNSEFSPGELVGYESEDGIVFAQVVCPMPCEGVEVAVTREYKVYIAEDDQEGLNVSALQLFKITTERQLQLYRESGAGKQMDHSADDDFNLTRAKAELCKELLTIWHLSEKERKRAIKRLYLQWHPDKNLDNPNYSEEVFKFLIRQVGLLEKGLPMDNPHRDDSAFVEEPVSDTNSTFWRDHFRRWDETARCHRHSRQSEQQYQKKQPGDREEADTAYYCQPIPDPEEGRRWIRQARDDYNALCDIYAKMTTSPKHAAYVCFMAHQVAEKALKGSMYVVCGLGSNGLYAHSLTNHALALEATRPEAMARISQFSKPLERRNYYLDTRYPNRVNPPDTPSEIFAIAQKEKGVADEAKNCAENILRLAECL